MLNGLNTYQDANIQINPDETLPPWERVNWNELNAMTETGVHIHLPPHGEQQYYELIGKYHQYSSGWNDFTGGANKEIISPNFNIMQVKEGRQTIITTRPQLQLLVSILTIYSLLLKLSGEQTDSMTSLQ